MTPPPGHETTTTNEYRRAWSSSYRSDCPEVLTVISANDQHGTFARAVDRARWEGKEAAEALMDNDSCFIEQYMSPNEEAQGKVEQNAEASMENVDGGRMA